MHYSSLIFNPLLNNRRYYNRLLGFKKLIAIADFFICVFDLALKIEFLHIKIVDQSGARSPKADDVEP